MRKKWHRRPVRDDIGNVLDQASKKRLDSISLSHNRDSVTCNELGVMYLVSVILLAQSAKRVTAAQIRGRVTRLAAASSKNYLTAVLKSEERVMQLLC